jgi:hypothetical protein
MKPLIVILGLRGSGRLAVARELAENGWSEGKVIRTFRESREAEPGAADTWTFAAQATTLPSPGEADAGILITHGGSSAVDQMEALHRILPTSGWQVQRIVTVVDCPLTQRHPDVAKWLEPCVHFSDVVVLNRRWEVPGQWVNKFLEPYAGDFYPCLFVNLLKNGTLSNPAMLIEGEPLRRSHIFDDIDAVDEMEFDEDNLPDEPFDLVRQPDKYFARDDLGRRVILVTDISEILRLEQRPG